MPNLCTAKQGKHKRAVQKEEYMARLNNVSLFGIVAEDPIVIMDMQAEITKKDKLF